MLERGTDGDRARARDRAHAADGRSLPRRVRRPDRRAAQRALSDGERYDAWLALRRGEKRIAVGARSAIFAPLANLGAIVVDEEHESSYKQGEAPRYHAREVAIVRARDEGAVVVLGSATPSLESWTNATSGKYALLDAARARRRRRSCRRSRSSTCARTRRSAQPSDGADADAASRCVISDAARGRAARPAREAASRASCCSTGAATRRSCSAATAATSRRARTARSAHVSPHARAARLPLLPARRSRCADAVRAAAATTLRQRGLGTQQVERLLAERFPSARIARMDVDTTSGKWAHAEILDRVGARRGRHPARHADDREGARLPERDARRRDRRGRRHQPAGLPRVGALLSAPQPGGGARGTRAEGRPGADPDARARRITPCVRGRARLHAVREGGAGRAAASRRIRRYAPRERRVLRAPRERDAASRGASVGAAATGCRDRTATRSP